MNLDTLTHQGSKYAANCIHEGDMKYWMAELEVLAVVKLQTENIAATSAVPTFGELMESLEIVRGKCHMLLGTSRPGSSYMRLG
jgi:hypothetical protein